MIRLIKRRLIIPRGDTGSFSIPTQGTVSENDIAIFTIFNPMTKKTELIKIIQASAPTLTFSFNSEDTYNIKPGKYNWDVTIYKEPQYDEEGVLVGATEVNSYYSAFKLPICEITEVALDMNEERWRTRDLLQKAQNTATNFGSLSSVYPWENIHLSALAQQLYKIAADNGYSGPQEEFVRKFGNFTEDWQIEVMPFEQFPDKGSQDKLYLDDNSNNLYRWNGEEYLLINSNFISGVIIQGGEA